MSSDDTTEEEAEPYTLGTFSFTREKNPDNLQYDRLATDDNNRLLFASLVGPANLIKGLKAMLSLREGKFTMEAAGLKVNRKGQDWYYAREPGRLVPADGGYQFEIHKMEYDTVHAMLFARAPGFMRVMNDEALWQELRRPEYTTPILRSWLPYIKQRLIDDGLLKDARCVRCECGILVCYSSDLDKYVSEGLKDGEIRIPEKDEAA